jgi:uncharacterized membrane protein YeaQ/YmgE (transglycosylase-associated protein family)
MINFILWLLFGALVGWLASIVMHTDARQGALLNIVVGIVGAVIGGWLFGYLIDITLRMTLTPVLWRDHRALYA